MSVRAMSQSLRRQTDFIFRLDGITTDARQVARWLASDLGYGKYDAGQTVMYPTCTVTVLRSTKQGIAYLIVYTVNSPQDRTNFHHWREVFIIAQDVFCALERRGFRVSVQHVDALLGWREG